MTTDRKAKATARALAAETGRSYTHARRADTEPAAAAPLAQLRLEALELAALLEAADPLLVIWGQAARRLAELDDAAAFHTGAVQLAWDIDDMRSTPAGHRCEALYRLRDNPSDAGHALARHARAVALDRCEIDEHDRPCSGPRSLSLAVWTEDGLSETWPELCVQHLVDYAERWDPRYAELVIGGEPTAAHAAFSDLHSRHPGNHNARVAGPGQEQYGRRLDSNPAGNADDDHHNGADALAGACDECGLPADECGLPADECGCAG